MATRKIQKSPKGGRPTLYRSEYADQARKYCLLGATNEDLAQFFEVSVATIKNWMRDHKEFLAAIKSGKEAADANVASRLYERALGYSHPDVDIRVIDGQIVQTELVKHYPPDTAAAFIWLKNRQPSKWRDKVEVQQETTHLFPDMTDSDARYAELWRKAQEEKQRYLGEDYE